MILAWRIEPGDLDAIADWLDALGCDEADVRKATRNVMGTNQGFTFSNPDKRMSLMCISRATSEAQWANTLVHEIDHLQHAILEYYVVAHGTEDAAYLQGYIMQKMVKAIREE